LLTRPFEHQARDSGWADHSAVAQLQTADLLARVDALGGPLLGVRSALAWCMPAVSSARSNRCSDDALEG
jgi:hypothetical protein